MKRARLPIYETFTIVGQIQGLNINLQELPSSSGFKSVNRFDSIRFHVFATLLLTRTEFGQINF